MKYLKYFNEDAEYQQFKETEEYILPNVSFVENSNTVNYSPYIVETKLVCTYNVTSTTSPTKLCIYVTGFSSMEVDGVMMDNVTTGYTFNTLGEHTVKFELADPTIIDNLSFQRCTSLTSVVIPNSVTSINQYAFNECSGLTGELVIPNSVTTIGDRAFHDCKGLTGELVIPDSVISIGDNAFYRCTGLEAIEIGSGVTTIGYGAFGYCSGLTGELVIPDSVTIIGGNAFSYCGGLTSVVIGSGVTKIGSNAFSGCNGLTSVVIPNSVTSIGNSAFINCSGLISVEIGSGVTSIGTYAFSYSQRLAEIVCHAPTAPTIDEYTFNDIKKSGVLKVPVGSDYSTWMSTGSYYLGYFNWTMENI